MIVLQDLLLHGKNVKLLLTDSHVVGIVRSWLHDTHIDSILPWKPLEQSNAGPVQTTPLL